MKIKKILQIGILASVILITFVHSYTAFAANDSTSTTTPVTADDLIYKFSSGTKEGAPGNTTDYIASLPETADIELSIGKIIKYALILANILAFISFVIAGVLMIISQGETETLDKAKSIFTMTVIAMVICAISLAVVVGVTQFDFFNV
ncbi:hypothetical protein KKD70_00115 [Patescibacteria group bacterium]|nr:hypothetical protein [Patescibacteria group bacterium]